MHDQGSWNHPLGDRPPHCSPARSAAGTTPGTPRLESNTAADGSLRWRAYCGPSDPEYGVRSTPLLSPDQAVVYTGSGDGNLYAFASGLGADTANHGSSPMLSTEYIVLISVVGGLGLLACVAVTLSCLRQQQKRQRAKEPLLTIPESSPYDSSGLPTSGRLANVASSADYAAFPRSGRNGSRGGTL